MSYWNYRILRRTLANGPIYGIVEAHYEHDGVVSAYSAEPYWNEFDKGNLPVTIDKVQKAFEADGSMPEWAFGIELSELPQDFKHMREALDKPTLWENEMWGGG